MFQSLKLEGFETSFFRKYKFHSILWDEFFYVISGRTLGAGELGLCLFQDYVLID